MLTITTRALGFASLLFTLHLHGTPNTFAAVREHILGRNYEQALVLGKHLLEASLQPTIAEQQKIQETISIQQEDEQYRRKQYGRVALLSLATGLLAPATLCVSQPSETCAFNTTALGLSGYWLLIGGGIYMQRHACTKELVLLEKLSALFPKERTLESISINNDTSAAPITNYGTLAREGH